MIKHGITVASMLFGFYVSYAEPVCSSSDGSLDTTFGNHGLVVTNMGDGERVGSVMALPCGRIVVAGDARVDEVNVDFALVGYTPFGALDDHFGEDGRVFTDLGTVLGTGPSRDSLFAATLQKDCHYCRHACVQKCDFSCGNNCAIVAVGSSNATESGQTGIAIVRYTCDGVLDTTFGINGSGVIVIPIASFAEAYAVAIQEDNKIVVVGRAQFGGTNVWVVIRLNCDGTLDQTFGCDHSGIVFIAFGTNARAQAVALQKDGRIVIAGFTTSSVLSTNFALARLLPNGNLDKSFGESGKVETDFSGDQISADSAEALVLVEECGKCNDCQSTLRIVAIGTSTPLGQAGTFALAGYTEKGRLDTSFGVRGLVTTSVGGDPSLTSAASAALVQRTCAGKCTILVGGFAVNEAVLADFALVRYTLGGTLDRTFGIGGMVITSFGIGTSSILSSLAQERNGDILAAGIVNNDNFAVARYTSRALCDRSECMVGCSRECGRVR